MLQETNQRQGDVMQANIKQGYIHHSKVECFPITAHPQMFHSSYITAICYVTFLTY